MQKESNICPRVMCNAHETLRHYVQLQHTKSNPNSVFITRFLQYIYIYIFTCSGLGDLMLVIDWLTDG